MRVQFRLKAITLPIHVVLFPVAVAVPVNGALKPLLHIDATLVLRTRSATTLLMRSLVVLFVLYSPYAPNTISSLPVVVMVPAVRVPEVAVARLDPSKLTVPP